jgi:hypothetical protein
MQFDRLAASDDVASAQWIAPRLAPFGSGVGSIVPGGFEAYARILHPATGSNDEPVRWDHVARKFGAVAHRLMQFHAVVGLPPTTDQVKSPKWKGAGPNDGDLEPRSLAALLDVLARHTADVDGCWFCLWDGYGWLPRSSDVIDLAAPATVALPSRTYLLYRGPLDAALELGYSPAPDWFMPQSPNLFWPDDLSWCVATEIDLFCTYVGGSRALVDELLADDRLEVWEAQLDDPVTFDSDLLNS